MNRNRLAILKLIRSGLISERFVPEEGLDWNYLYVACYRQRIISIVYQAIKDNRITIPAEYLRLFQVGALKEIKADRDQSRMLEELFRKFEEQKITYLPLKGSYIKYLYPKTEFRQMGDADIYILQEEYDRIRPVMEQLGFSFVEETYHEFVWNRKDGLEAELHKSIVDPRYGMLSFFDSFKDRIMGRRTEGYRVDMDITEHLVYSVMHLAKHFISGTVNIRNLLDIYILRKDSKVDGPYLEKCLNEVSLKKFYDVLCNALDEWFGEKPFTEDSEKLFDRVLAVSSENTENQQYTFKMFREQDGDKKISFWQKTKYCLKRVFLPLESMKKFFPVLEKAPVLLPVFWIWRPIYRLFTDRKHVKRFYDVSFKEPNEKVGQYRKEMEYLGLENMITEYDDEIK